MPNIGPIVIIEDDADDQQLIGDALREVGVKNEFLFFETTKEAVAYLLSGKQPFLIICDVNLPAQNGIEFKDLIDKNPLLRKKSIPFIFFTTNPQREKVIAAYEQMTVQGFFKKPVSFQEYITLFRSIIDYWTVCCHPNDMKA